MPKQSANKYSTKETIIIILAGIGIIVADIALINVILWAYKIATKGM